MFKISLLISTLLFLVGCGGDTTSERDRYASDGTYVHVSNDSYGTDVDVKVKAVKRFHTEGNAVDVVISDDGDVAYVASGEAGVEVIDVRDPESPHLIYHYDVDEYVNHVEVKDDVVYVSYVSDDSKVHYSVHAFNVEDRYHPYYVSSAKNDNGTAHSSATYGNYHYEVNSDGLEIFSNYSGKSYFKVGSYYLHDSAYSVAVDNDYVYVANGREGLTILKTNINTPLVQIR